MHTPLKLVIMLLSTCLINTVLAQSPGQSGQRPADPAANRLLSFPNQKLRWIEIPDTGGIRYANVKGKLNGHGPYEAFVLFPAGKDNPPHYHSHTLPTVVLKGTFYAMIDGKRVDYPAGSYYQLPSRLPHRSGCAAGEDCLLFQFQPDQFDLNVIPPGR